MALAIFIVFIIFLIFLSWYLGKKSNSEEGFFVAGGQIHWFINGIALTGGYLSAASFLGICGMIAFKGFDGYLYSIGFLSGWIVALFVIAEPIRRLGKFTFADALGARFESRHIHLAAAISTLVISLCYLVPQMVGAGVLIEPLLGISHHWGVIMVGAVVIFVVASAGMSSTTYVQFLKAGMLILFSGILVAAICFRGLSSTPEVKNFSGKPVTHYIFKTIPVHVDENKKPVWGETLKGNPYEFSDIVYLNDENKNSVAMVLLEEWVELQIEQDKISYSANKRGTRIPVIRDPEGAIATLVDSIKNLSDNESALSGGLQETIIQNLPCKIINNVPHIKIGSWWLMAAEDDKSLVLRETQSIEKFSDGKISVNGLPSNVESSLLPMGRISKFGNHLGEEAGKGAIGPIDFFAVFSDADTEVELPRNTAFNYNGRDITAYYHVTVKGNKLMRPGGHFKLTETWSRLDFISLMIALFFGTSALPHVLIRYYTVKDSQAARKSTIVAITAIGIFYILTLYLGLGAIANGVLNPQSDNMSAPLLARSFGEPLFAAITALAFATVLGTVSGLIIAASGAIANDIVDKYMQKELTGKSKVYIAKFTAITVGIISVILGILFKGVNVGFLVGWAFAVAASANFPAIVMVLFWKRTTASGVVSSILIGTATSMGIILLGPEMFELYGLTKADAWIPLGQPAIFSIPISFITLILVSLFSSKKKPS